MVHLFFKGLFLRNPHLWPPPVFGSDMALVGSFFGHQKILVEAQRYGAQILHARDACPEPPRFLVFFAGGR